VIDDDKIAKVIWRDITFIKDREMANDEEWDSALIRWETIGRVMEKDGILRIVMDRPIHSNILDEFYTTNSPMTMLVPMGNVEEIEILEPAKKKNKGTRRGA